LAIHSWLEAGLRLGQPGNNEGVALKGCRHRRSGLGDQGHVGGNDFELLAATRWSLSIDRCSSDPTRSWNLVQSGQKGPAALILYLRALQRRRRGEVRLNSASLLSSMELA